MKRVFKTKTFDRWARKVVSDALLCEAAHQIEQGLFEADLGGGCAKSAYRYPVKVNVAQPAHWLRKNIKTSSSF